MATKVICLVLCVAVIIGFEFILMRVFVFYKKKIMSKEVQQIKDEIIRLKEIAEYNLTHYKMDRSACMQQAAVCTKLLSFIDSMQEEPQVKESAKIQHVNEMCKENSDSLTQEPASEDLEELVEQIKKK